jgi:hypothetical protein
MAKSSCPFSRGYPCGNIPIKPGSEVFTAFQKMPAHLVEALEFEPESMLLMESSMPEGFDFFCDSSDDEEDLFPTDLLDISWDLTDSDEYDWYEYLGRE